MLNKEEIYVEADNMYRVLELYSLCQCAHRWNGNERMLVRKCQRCLAMDRWEIMTGKQPHPVVHTAKGKMEVKGT